MQTSVYEAVPRALRVLMPTAEDCSVPGVSLIVSSSWHKTFPAKFSTHNSMELRLRTRLCRWTLKWRKARCLTIIHSSTVCKKRFHYERKMFCRPTIRGNWNDLSCRTHGHKVDHSAPFYTLLQKSSDISAGPWICCNGRIRAYPL